MGGGWREGALGWGWEIGYSEPLAGVGGCGWVGTVGYVAYCSASISAAVAGGAAE